MASAPSDPVPYQASVPCARLDATPPPVPKPQATGRASHSRARATVYRYSNASRSTGHRRPAQHFSHRCRRPDCTAAHPLPSLLRFLSPALRRVSRRRSFITCEGAAVPRGATAPVAVPGHGPVHTHEMPVASPPQGPGERSRKPRRTTQDVARFGIPLELRREFMRTPALSSRDAASDGARVELYLYCSRGDGKGEFRQCPAENIRYG